MVLKSKNKIKFLLSILMMLGVGAGISTQHESVVKAAETTTSTYIFNSSSWGATRDGDVANWIGSTNGAGFSNNGVQITTNKSNTSATSPDSFVDVTQVEVIYNTNKDSGKGGMTIAVGSTSLKEQSVGYSGNNDGRTASFKSTFDFSDNPASGKVKLTVTCSKNSIYVVSVSITETKVKNLEEVETMANLGFSYSMTKPDEADSEIDLDTIDSVNSNYENVEGEGLSYFKIKGSSEKISEYLTSIYFEKNTAKNAAYVGGTNHEVRLYNNNDDKTNGGAVTFFSDYTIVKIIFTIISSGDCIVKIGTSKETHSYSSGEHEVLVNDNQVTIQNNNSKGTRLDLSSFKLVISKSEESFSSFSNIRARFTAHIPSDIYNTLDIERAGVKVSIPNDENVMDIEIPVENFVAGDNEYSFTAAVTNIPETAFNIEMTATAYVVLQSGETINLKSKTISVMGMVDRYLEERNPFNLSASELKLMQAFKDSYSV